MTLLSDTTHMFSIPTLDNLKERVTIVESLEVAGRRGPSFHSSGAGLHLHLSHCLTRQPIYDSSLLSTQHTQTTAGPTMYFPGTLAEVECTHTAPTGASPVACVRADDTFLATLIRRAHPNPLFAPK